MRISKKAAAKAAWLAEFEDRLVALYPLLAGKLDWDTATFFYNEGLSTEQAVERASRRAAGSTGGE